MRALKELKMQLGHVWEKEGFNPITKWLKVKSKRSKWEVCKWVFRAHKDLDYGLGIWFLLIAVCKWNNSPRICSFLCLLLENQALVGATTSVLEKCWHDLVWFLRYLDIFKRVLRNPKQAASLPLCYRMRRQWPRYLKPSVRLLKSEGDSKCVMMKQVASLEANFKIHEASLQSLEIVQCQHTQPVHLFLRAPVWWEHSRSLKFPLNCYRQLTFKSLDYPATPYKD